ncbi:N-acetylglucosaminyl phosphatidylinositol deacetylase-related protein, partial [Kipferlia bialata]
KGDREIVLILGSDRLSLRVLARVVELDAHKHTSSPSTLLAKCTVVPLFTLTDPATGSPLPSHNHHGHSLQSVLLDTCPPKRYVWEDTEEIASLVTDAGSVDLVLFAPEVDGHAGVMGVRDTQPGPVMVPYQHRLRMSDDCGGFEHTPSEAYAVGMGCLSTAKKIIVVAVSELYGEALVKTLDPPHPSADPTSLSLLVSQKTLSLYVDPFAVLALPCIATPWLHATSTLWTQSPRLVKSAVVWTAQQTGKAIPTLTSKDFLQRGLGGLIAKRGLSALLSTVQRDIADRVRFACPIVPLSASDPHPTVVVFSPHPDDDVVSMGGTLSNLQAHGCDVHVAYMVSGSNAVSTDSVLAHSRFAETLADLNPALKGVSEWIKDNMDSKEIGIQLKGAVRRTEATAAVEGMGVPQDHVHFLDLPFYTTKSAPEAPENVDRVSKLLNALQPSHLFLAADLCDPHGTHGACYEALKAALSTFSLSPPLPPCKCSLCTQGMAPSASQLVPLLGALSPPDQTHTQPEHPRLWLYRGAWQDYPADQADVILALTGEQLTQKLVAIQRHFSQGAGAMFKGTDSREFWERARDRNKALADELAQLGQGTYVAAEAFTTGFELP